LDARHTSTARNGEAVSTKGPVVVGTTDVAALYASCSRPLHRYLRRFVATDHDAEDLIQNVFVNVLRYRHSYTPQGRGVEAWIFRIAHNTAIDHLRKHSREVLPGEQLPERSVEPAADWDAQIDFRDSLGGLPPRDRRLVYMRVVLDMSSKDVATAERRTLSSVDCAHHRAKIKLREQLRAWDPPEKLAA
jgi:RNA polymerase sigma-70 factor, ECF subfamily